MLKVKISAQDKVKAVESYLKGEGTLRSIAIEYEVHHSCLEKWISLYQIFGAEGVERPRVNKKYPLALKDQAVKSYLQGSTLRRVCEEYEIRSFSILQSWVAKYEKDDQVFIDSGN